MAMKTLAKKIREGISKGDPSVRGMGIDHATVQRLYRLMKADSYDGSIAFYVCEKLREEVLGRMVSGLRMWEKAGKELLSTEELLQFVTEKDKDVLFCALQGALMQSDDKVGKKCLEVISKLYVSI